MNEIIFKICLLVVIYFFGGFERFLIFIICSIPVSAGSALIILGLYDFGVINYILLIAGLGMCIVSAYLLSIMDDKTLLLLGLYDLLVGISMAFDTTEKGGLGQYPAVTIICGIIIAAVPVAAVIRRYKRTGELPWYLQRTSIFELWKFAGFMRDEEQRDAEKNYDKNGHSHSVSDFRRVLDDVLESSRLSDDKYIYESARKERKTKFIKAVKPYFDEDMVKLIYAGKELCVIDVSGCFYTVCPYVLINSHAFGVPTKSKAIEHIIEDERGYLMYISCLSEADYKKYVIFLNPESMQKNQQFIEKVIKDSKPKDVDKELEERIVQKYGEPEIWYDEN